jgi:multiple sugar transport system permease protein
MSIAGATSDAGSGVPGRRHGRRIPDPRFGLLCTLPALLVMCAVIVIPLARTLLMSFQKYVLVDPTTIGQFVGFQNYAAVFENDRFWKSVLRSGYFTAGVLGGQFVLGLGTALLLNQRIRFRGLIRTLILLPWILPQAQIVLLSIWMFNPEYGILNWLLKEIGLIAGYKVWLNSMDLSMPTLILINVYRGYPFMMLMFLSGLQAIPVEVVEASIVDGANALQRFRYVTIPYLRYVLLVVLLTSFIWYMPHFMTIWALTEGGPVDRTFTLALAIYETAFKTYDFGLASAEGSVWLVITLAFCAVFVYLFSRQDR